MGKLLIFLSAILISTCSNTTKVDNDKPLKLDFKELNYGLCQTKKEYSEKMENSPSGNHILSSGFILVKKTDTIPAQIGQQFGVEYIIESNLTKNIIVEQVWTFPKKVRNEKGIEISEVRYKIEKLTNDKTYSIYTLEKEFEIIKGVWTYQMLYDGKKIYEKKFQLE